MALMSGLVKEAGIQMNSMSWPTSFPCLIEFALTIYLSTQGKSEQDIRKLQHGFGFKAKKNDESCRGSRPPGNQSKVPHNDNQSLYYFSLFKH